MSLLRKRTFRFPRHVEIRESRRPFTDAANRYLDEHPEAWEALARVLIERAIGGNMRAIRMLWDRIDGPVSIMDEFYFEEEEEPKPIRLPHRRDVRVVPRLRSVA